MGFTQLGLAAEFSVWYGENESYLPNLQRREWEEQRELKCLAGWLIGGVWCQSRRHGVGSPATRSYSPAQTEVGAARTHGPGIVWASAHGNSLNRYHRTFSWSGKLINTDWSLRCPSQCWRSQKTAHFMVLCAETKCTKESARREVGEGRSYRAKRKKALEAGAVPRDDIMFFLIDRMGAYRKVGWGWNTWMWKAKKLDLGQWIKPLEASDRGKP